MSLSVLYKVSLCFFPFQFKPRLVLVCTSKCALCSLFMFLPPVFVKFDVSVFCFFFLKSIEAGGYA